MRNKLNTSGRQKLSLSMKIIIGGAAAFMAGLLLVLQSQGLSSDTILPGTWNNSTTWSAGVPGNDATANINHSLTLDKNLTISGSYTINAPVQDLPSGSLYSLSIVSGGILDANANMTFEGSGSVSNNGKLILRSGDTLRIGATVFDNGSTVIIEEGAVLIVNGNLENKNNSDGVTVNGKIVVNGNFTGGNGSEINGNGDFTTTGSTTGAGSVFGASPMNCSGPCDGHSLVGFTNTISSPQSICTGGTPATLTGSTTATSPTYKWQKSTDNSTYTTISGATSASYSPGPLVVSTYYRRVVTSGGTSSTSGSVKITINASGLWTGTVSNKWNFAGNWCGEVIPVATANVTIPAGVVNMPSVPSGNFTCNNLTILTGASFTMESGSTLTVKGNIINGGTFTDNGGTIVFSGIVPQTITGITSMGSLTLNNPLSLILGNAITVNGIIKLTKGMIVSNGLLTVNLNAGGIDYKSSDLGSIYGAITVKKNVSSNLYHYLSSPLTGQTVADWNDNVSKETGKIYYYYDETNTSPDKAIGWVGINSLSTALTPMKGYALYFRSAKLMNNTGTYTHGSSPFSINVTNTMTASSGADGWNLVGNPYPSTIDWDAASGWTKTNIYSAVYCWDAPNNRYTSYVGGIGVNGGSRYIASMQAFWIRVDTTKTSGTLSATSLVRSSNAATFYRQSASSDPIVRMSILNNNYEDEAVVRLMDEATDDYDGNYDASKKMNTGNHPSLYSQFKGMSYAINSIKYVDEEIEIPLSIQVKEPGVCKFTAKEVKNFDASYSIILEDKMLNISQNLKDIPTYQFNATSVSTVGRFTLRIKKPTTITTSINNSKGDQSVKITLEDRSLYVRSNTAASGEASVYIISSTGIEMGKIENASFSSGELMYDMSSYQTGVYIVKAIINKKVFTQKVIIP